MAFVTRFRAPNPRRPFPTTALQKTIRGTLCSGLAFFRFRSPLLTEYLFLQVLRCFTSLRSLRFARCTAMTPCEFPHSEILGSKPCWRLPEAYRSLIRLSSAQRAKAFTICSVSGFSSQKNRALSRCKDTKRLLILLLVKEARVHFPVFNLSLPVAGREPKRVDRAPKIHLIDFSVERR